MTIFYLKVVNVLRDSMYGLTMSFMKISHFKPPSSSIFLCTLDPASEKIH